MYEFIVYKQFLTHLSLRLKSAFLIKICPLSVVVIVIVVVVVVVVGVVVNSHIFIIFFRTTGLISGLTWHKTSLGEGGSSLYKWRAPTFSKGR